MYIYIYMAITHTHTHTHTLYVQSYIHNMYYMQLYAYTYKQTYQNIITIIFFIELTGAQQSRLLIGYVATEDSKLK